jgi:uncharacterized repeat protein (TIGR01451 family)
VFSDADADVTINGSDAGTNAGSASLTIYAVNSTGNVVDKATVVANGTYSLTNVPVNSSVTLRLSNDASVAIGAIAPTNATIPSGWYFTGENINGTVDGAIATLGNIALTTTTSNIINQNFGIRQGYVIAPDPAPNTCNPDYTGALTTGISASGGQLSVGSYDLNWTAEWITGLATGVNAPFATPRPVGPMPAVVVGNQAPGAWVNEPSNARWISYPFRLSSNGDALHQDANLNGSNSNHTGTTTDAVRVKFTAMVTLPSNANTIAISLPIGVSVDNQFVSVKINGVENLVPPPTFDSQAESYRSFSTVNLQNGWQPGVNTIEIVVDSGPPLVGFFVKVNAATTQVCGSTLSGSVFNDSNGNKLQNSPELGTNGGGLNAVLVNGSNAVVATAAVATDGTYSFPDILPGTYTVQITTATATVGSPAPAIALPNNWVSTGENLNGTADGTVDGKQTITVGTTAVTGINFGIEQLPDTTPVTGTNQTNPGGTTTVQAPTLAGTDPEDGALSTGKTFQIVTLPTNGTLYYNGVAITAPGPISNYDPTLLNLDPTDDGPTSVSFTYAAVDAAGQADPTPATVTMPFSGAPKLLLVKRITAINGTTTGRDLNGTAINLTQFVNDPNTTDDNNANWAGGYLAGAIDGGVVKPNDELEYTIYFLSSGTSTAKNVLLCDRLPDNTTFLPTGFNAGSFAADPTGLPGADRGIVLSLGLSGNSLSNVGDSDRAQFFPSGVEPSTVFPNINCGGPNTTGAVVVNIGDVVNATAPGTPTNSYGFLRFRATVK